MSEDLVIKLGIGLAGVVIGFFLTFIKEIWFKKKDKQKELEYLTIRLTCAFDKFISGCFDVVYDDGLFQGQPDKDGCRRAQVTPPSIKPDEIDVNWKVLPSKLMYTILNFPEKIEHANGTISSVVEHVAFPPDYDEFFEERRYQYSELGLLALQINSELRGLGKLPTKIYGDWNSPEKMKSLNESVVEQKKQREMQQHKMWEKINSKKESEDTSI